MRMEGLIVFFGLLDGGRYWSGEVWCSFSVFDVRRRVAQVLGRQERKTRGLKVDSMEHPHIQT